MSNDLEARVLQIRRAHAQAKPKDSNPAWKNCHRDMEVMFKFIKELEDECRALSALNREIDAKLSELERQNAELRSVLQVLREGKGAAYLGSDYVRKIDAAIAADQKGKAS